MLRGYTEDCLKRKPLPRKLRGKNLLQWNGFQLYQKETGILDTTDSTDELSEFSRLASAHAPIEQKASARGHSPCLV